MGLFQVALSQSGYRLHPKNIFPRLLVFSTNSPSQFSIGQDIPVLIDSVWRQSGYLSQPIYLPKRPRLICSCPPQSGQGLSITSGSESSSRDFAFRQSGKPEQARNFSPRRFHFITIGSPHLSQFSSVFSIRDSLISFLLSSTDDIEE